MYKHLFSQVDINPENINIPDGNAANLAKECEEYEQKILRAGGIQLFLGGVGPDGHIAFNEPGSSLNSRTRVKTLAYDTILANSRFFGNDINKVPRTALTVGIKTIMDAREVVIVATGVNKAKALQKGLEEGINHMWTLSALQLHQHPLIVADEDATLELKVKTVKVRTLTQHHNKRNQRRALTSSSQTNSTSNPSSSSAPTPAPKVLHSSTVHTSDRTNPSHHPTGQA